MFESCSKLTTLDLSHFDTANGILMTYMFQNCTNLKLDCSNWNVNRCINHDSFNNGASGVIAPKTWSTSNDENDNDLSIQGQNQSTQVITQDNNSATDKNALANENIDIDNSQNDNEQNVTNINNNQVKNNNQQDNSINDCDISNTNNVVKNNDINNNDNMNMPAQLNKNNIQNIN